MTDILTRLRELAGRATPGPRGWFGNAGSQSLYLATVDQGRRFIMQFARWGMRGSQPRFQVNGRMVDASELLEFEVCHAIGAKAAKLDKDCYRLDVVGIDHPDARFIAALDPATVTGLLDTIAEANARVAVLVDALTWAVPLAERALEEHRVERLRFGHNDIGAGTDHLGLWDNEAASRTAARAALKDLPTAARALIEERDGLKARLQEIDPKGTFWSLLGAARVSATTYKKAMEDSLERAESAEARVAEEKERANGNFASAERVIAKYSDAVNRIAALEKTQPGVIRVCRLCQCEISIVADRPCQYPHVVRGTQACPIKSALRIPSGEGEGVSGD